jgi:hypothetical protein
MWWTSAIIALGGRRRLCRGCLFLTKADIGRPFRRIGSPAGSACHFFIIIVIRHETTAILADVCFRAVEAIDPEQPHVRFWPKADILIAWANVRFRG